ncbi:hypothetical protein H4Q26_004999 [Puccinia striiformis f. sp. tritici PST-130]|nr:hypothetical protein H4Q26_004999 [Puccinia striiformis f. sp. tritici PST-130]
MLPGASHRSSAGRCKTCSWDQSSPSSPSPDPSPSLTWTTPDQLKPDSGTAADNKPKAEELAGIPTAVPRSGCFYTTSGFCNSASPSAPSAPPTVPPPQLFSSNTDPLNPGSGATANTTSKAEQSSRANTQSISDTDSLNPIQEQLKKSNQNRRISRITSPGGDAKSGTPPEVKLKLKNLSGIKTNFAALKPNKKANDKKIFNYDVPGQDEKLMKYQ